jgi:anti-sigma factor RsiW
MDHERWQEWIDIAAEGELGAAERRSLDEHLAGCTACRGELARSERLTARLGAARVAVRPGFAGEVMAALEPAAWEARAPRAWRWPLAALVAVGGASAALFGIGAAELEPGAGSAGALYAIADLLRAAFVAGSGIAAASWRGVGAAVGDWLGDSAANWSAAAMLVFGSNYLLYRLVRRRPRAAAAERER